MVCAVNVDQKNDGNGKGEVSLEQITMQIKHNGFQVRNILIEGNFNR